MKLTKTDVQLGADVEFAFWRNGELVPANTLIYDEERSFPLGIDGHAATAEIRPGISQDPLDLIGRIAKILDTAVKEEPKLTKLVWKAGAYLQGSAGWAALGGHIHLSAEGIIDPHGSNQLLKNGVDQAVYPLEHLIPVSERTNRNSRLDSTGVRYGARNSWRYKGDYHLEYRTPSSWLYSPELAYCYLALTKSVAQTILGQDEIQAMRLIRDLDKRTDMSTPELCLWVKDTEYLNLEGGCQNLPNVLTNVIHYFSKPRDWMESFLPRWI